ncbi:RNA-binding protein [bacterium]|nr:RNA-binding protein [bacterium]
MQEDQQFLENLVKALVDHPDDVKIDRTVDEMGVLLTLDVHAEDMGKIIGRSGNTAKAIRTLLRVVGMKNEARVNLKINEPEGGRPMSAQSTASEAVESSEAETTEEVEPAVNLDQAIDDLKI